MNLQIRELEALIGRLPLPNFILKREGGAFIFTQEIDELRHKICFSYTKTKTGYCIDIPHNSIVLPQYTQWIAELGEVHGFEEWGSVEIGLNLSGEQYKDPNYASIRESLLGYSINNIDDYEIIKPGLEDLVGLYCLPLVTQFPDLKSIADVYAGIEINTSFFNMAGSTRAYFFIPKLLQDLNHNKFEIVRDKLEIDMLEYAKEQPDQYRRHKTYRDMFY